MKSSQIDRYLLSYLPNFLLLLVAIDKVTELVFWLDMVVFGIIVVGLCIFLFRSFQMLKKDRKNWMYCVLGDPQDDVYDVMIGIVGLIVGIAFNDMTDVIFWIGYIAVGIGEIIDPPAKIRTLYK